MNCYAHQLAFSAAGAMALLYTIGAIVLLFFPEQTAFLWAPLAYVSADQLPHLHINFISYLYGVVQSFVYTYIYARIFGALYSHLTPEL
jgi:hypothetical protein